MQPLHRSAYNTMLQTNPEAARNKAATIIKNTCRTLMTRAQKGCFVYSVDPETNRYIKECMALKPE